MGTSKLSSNSIVAQGAISELVGIDTSSHQNKTISLGSSNVTSMKAGESVSNQMLNLVSDFSSVILKQAKKFPELAHKIEERDFSDAQQFKK